MSDNSADVIVVGAGAAGVFAAIKAADSLCKGGGKVLLLEGTRRPLAKVKVSGGGRCNVTHHCFEPSELVKNYPRGSKELRGPFSVFQPQDTIDWFKDRGVKLKVEEDGRMFPTTDSSQTVIDCLLTALEKSGAQLVKGQTVKSLRKVESGFAVETRDQKYHTEKLMLATGSMPAGHALASSLGHRIVDPVPSLFTFTIKDRLLTDLSGLSFSSVNLELSFEDVKKPFKYSGPLLITHWGLSGPGVLKLSAFAAREFFQSDYNAQLKVNFLPGMDGASLESILLETQKEHPKKQISNVVPAQLPKRFWQMICQKVKVQDVAWAAMSKQRRLGLVDALIRSRFEIQGKGEFKEEFVTCGGVHLKEVNFKTMESRMTPGLFFGGELLDIDGITGGFNFQNAWTTGYLAGCAMGKK